MNIVVVTKVDSNKKNNLFVMKTEESFLSLIFAVSLVFVYIKIIKYRMKLVDLFSCMVRHSSFIIQQLYLRFDTQYKKLM